jgi:hypothetical protein
VKGVIGALKPADRDVASVDLEPDDFILADSIR